MVHYNIAPDTLEKMVEARRQLEEAILKYEPVIEKLEELWETKVKFNCIIGPALFVCGFTSQSTAMVMSRRSVNLTTLFPGEA